VQRAGEVLAALTRQQARQELGEEFLDAGLDLSNETPHIAGHGQLSSGG
jgi:hypothetical protein